MEKKAPNLENYIELFKFESYVPYLFGYDFVDAYRRLDGMVITDKNSWRSYMSKNALKKSLEEGLELFRSEEKYAKLKSDLYGTYELTTKLSYDLLNSELVSTEDLKNYFEATRNFRIHYQYAEFFYTDLAFQKQTEYPEITKNFESFEQFKLDGRDYLNKIFLSNKSQLNSIVEKISKDFNLPVDDLNAYSTYEILRLVDGDRIEDIVLQKRRNAHIVHNESDEISEIIGDEALEIISSLLNHSYKTELKGQVASKGVVTARARVFNFKLDEFDKLYELVEQMQDGEVLVAETTEPSIIMACNKASAIVTNQGGMMSHAAIVSREMKIPCIVGTGNATSVIKTGDMVEVDAINGIVKIL